MTRVQEEREKEKGSRQNLRLELETTKRKVINLDAAILEQWDEERMWEGSLIERERRRQLEEQEEAFVKKIREFYESPKKKKERVLEEKLSTYETIMQKQKALLVEAQKLSDRLTGERQEQKEKIRRILAQKDLL